MKDDRIYLQHILDSIGYVLSDTAGGREEFFANRTIRDAVIRNLEVIGEAVKNLSDDLKASRPEVPWKRIAGMRDKLIHEYFGVNIELVWDVVSKQLPVLRDEIEKLLDDLGGFPAGG